MTTETTFQDNQWAFASCIELFRSKLISLQAMEDHLRQVEHLRVLSRSVIYHLLTKILKYSLKRLIKFPSKMLGSEKIKDFVDAMFLQLWLEKQGFMLIFVDEFHVNMKTSNLWNWSIRGIPALLPVDPNSWAMSFVLAFSKNKIEGIMASDHSIYSKTFWKFINDVYVSIKNDDEESANPWFIMDNWSVYISN